MPRMTTFMLAGEDDPEDILRSLPRQLGLPDAADPPDDAQRKLTRAVARGASHCTGPNLRT